MSWVVVQMRQSIVGGPRPIAHGLYETKREAEQARRRLHLSLFLENPTQRHDTYAVEIGEAR